MSDYFSNVRSMSKPEHRAMKDIVTGILKSQTMFVNQIAASLRESLKLKDVTKRLSAQYLKDDYADKILKYHLSTASQGVHQDSFIVMDGTDISKRYAKFMEGLEFVKNGDTGEIGLGYNVLNINAINSHKEITPLYSKAYSFEMGALSSNHEIKCAVKDVDTYLQGKGCWVIDNTLKTVIFCLEYTKVVVHGFHLRDKRRHESLCRTLRCVIGHLITLRRE